MKTRHLLLGLFSCFAITLSHATDDTLGRASAAGERPWVYWFWMDGNISREGITADLEAMRRAGIEGVAQMEVDVGIPRGPVKFMGPEWREMFKHVAREADRLGIKVDINASPGWTGSGGPWITPEQSMQKVVFTKIEVSGPRKLDEVLTQPETKEGYYRDIAVMAMPTPENGATIPNIDEKAVFKRGHFSSESGVRRYFEPEDRVPETSTGVTLKSIVMLNDRMTSDGTIQWDVPEGKWTLLRFGHTSTGANTRPAPLPGLGLECDKFSTVALELHWKNFIGKLLSDSPGYGGKSLTSVHIDSWEMGPQNWTAGFDTEFKKRRGYDPIPYLPVLTGTIVDNGGISERFLWDWRRTILELITENYAGHMRTLAHDNKMLLSIQPYDGTPCDDMTYGARADVPMCEFWANCFDTYFSCAQASSIAHTYGKRVVAAEAFTSDDTERWLLHPGEMKALGDWAFCEGVNRFAFHRYAHQPWLDRRPGMTMGIYGIHYERTQTWWDLVRSYNDYLSRCQFLLQQGDAVADVCLLLPEESPQVFRSPLATHQMSPPERPGHNFDACTPEAFLTRATVENGRIMFPGGTSYAVFVLPRDGVMTPQYAKKVAELVEKGATVIGPKPTRAPGLTNFPNTDNEVRAVGERLWGKDTQPNGSKGPGAGKGRVFWMNAEPEKPAIAEETHGAKWIWKDQGSASSAPPGRMFFRRSFDVGDVSSAALWATADNSFRMSVNGKLALTGNNFHRGTTGEITSLLRKGKNVVEVQAENAGEKPNPAGFVGWIEIRSANGQPTYVVTDDSWEAAEATNASWAAARVLGTLGMQPWGNVFKSKTGPEPFPYYREVENLLLDMGIPPDFQSTPSLRFAHRRLTHRYAIGDQVTTEDIYFVANPQDEWVTADCIFRTVGDAPQLFDPMTGRVYTTDAAKLPNECTFVTLKLEPHGSIFLRFQPGSRPGTAGSPRYETLTTSTEIAGPWKINFPENTGAPKAFELKQLTDLSKHTEAGIRHFSGKAKYTARFTIGKLDKAKRYFVDLGDVQVMARVTINGKEVGTTWKRPFQLELGEDVLKNGNNTIEVEVANLWPNRLIGDSALPEKERVASTTWNPFAPTDELPKSGLIGPVIIGTEK